MKIAARSAYRAFEVEVVRARRLSPSFARVTLAGPDLDRFQAAGWDQRVKLAFAPAGGRRFDAPDGDFLLAWRAAPPAERDILRTYTVAGARPEALELDVDFALHPGGVAARWASRVRPGAPLLVIGPDRDAGLTAPGVQWRVDADGPVLLVGDETALPAIASVLPALPDGAHGTVLIETRDPADARDIARPAGVDVRWLPRRLGEAPGAALEVELACWIAEAEGEWRRRAPISIDEGADAEVLWDVPVAGSAAAAASPFAWLAGEAGSIRRMRRLIGARLGIARENAAFMGYWRAGKPGY